MEINIFLWIFLFVISGLVGFIVYLFYKMRKSNNEVSKLTNEVEKSNTEINNLSNEIEKLDYEKLIFTIHPEFQKYAQSRLDDIKRFINGFKDKRTGQLPRFDYYYHLNDNVKRITKDDKIWACSTLLENEWDSNDDDERTLMHNFRIADERGVSSTRIFIFKNEKLLKPEDEVPKMEISDDNFPKSYYTIKNLLPYLKNDIYLNTHSVAIGKAEFEQLTEKQKKLLGNGFCAFDYHRSNDTFFFYDTPSDESGVDKLGFGEILFDQTKIKEIRDLFDMIIGSKRELKKYIFDRNNANDSVKEFLKNNGVEPQKEEITLNNYQVINKRLNTVELNNEVELCTNIYIEQNKKITYLPEELINIKEILTDVKTYINNNYNELSGMIIEYKNKTNIDYDDKNPMTDLSVYSNSIKTLIMTANPIEFYILHSSCLKPLEEKNKVLRFSFGDYFIYVGMIENNKVIHVASNVGSKSDGGSNKTTEDMIKLLEPKIVISVGVAFGNDYKKQNIGDVLVPTIINAYDLSEKITDGKIEYNKSAWVTNTSLYVSNKIKNLYINDGFELYPGQLLTADKVYDSLIHRNALFNDHANAIGGDMEAYGIYRASQESDVFCALIKGICDWGAAKNALSTNKTQSDEAKDMLQLKAMKNACIVLKKLLQNEFIFSDLALHNIKKENDNIIDKYKKIN